MFIKLKNCLEHEDVDCSFGDVEYFILTEKIEKMRAFKESTDRFNDRDETYFCLEILANFTDDQDWECYYFKTKADRDEVIEQIINRPVFVETFDK